MECLVPEMTASQEQIFAVMRVGQERLGGPDGVPPRKDDGHELVRKDGDISRQGSGHDKGQPVTNQSLN
jgi:hypothetical protein